MTQVIIAGNLVKGFVVHGLFGTPQDLAQYRLTHRLGAELFIAEFVDASAAPAAYNILPQQTTLDNRPGKPKRKTLEQMGLVRFHPMNNAGKPDDLVPLPDQRTYDNIARPRAETIAQAEKEDAYRRGDYGMTQNADKVNKQAHDPGTQPVHSPAFPGPAADSALNEPETELPRRTDY